MQSELLTYAHMYHKPFPSFQKPEIIGYIDYENVMFARSVKNKEVKIDLNILINEAKRKPHDLDVKITALLRFLLEHKIRLNLLPNRSLNKAQFFCFRGLLTCIACTPYERREDWRIVAILHLGNIYLCARDTEVKRKKKQNVTETEQKFTSWGYKFEQSVLSEKPDIDPNPMIPVDENKEFSLVFKGKLNNHVIIYAAEMDGIRCDKHPMESPPPVEAKTEVILDYLSDKDYIEVKTNRHLEFANQERNFRIHKTKKWWCQSFLAGVNTILCGFRDDNGIVEMIEVFEVQKLSKMSQNFWNPSACFNFLDTFLTYVKRCLEREIKHKYGWQALNNLQSLPLISLHFEWKPGEPVCVTNNYVYDDDPILPQWFIDNFPINST